jgi:hypothetical protein
MELFKANFAKEILLMRRNSFVYIFKTVQVLIYFFHSLSLCHLLALFLSSFALGGAVLILVGFPNVPCNESYSLCELNWGADWHHCFNCIHSFSTY